MKKAVVFFFIIFITFGLNSCQSSSYHPVSNLDKNKEVTLRIAIPTETDSGIDYIANEFSKRYSNVKFLIDYYENYDRIAGSLVYQNKADIIFLKGRNYVNNESLNTEDYFLNFDQDDEVDFSSTTEKLNHNYLTHDTKNRDYFYCVPVGGEVRGIFVNRTFLDEFNLKVPSNWHEFLNCCSVIKKAGYIPIQGNPSSTGIALGMADAVNSFVHDENKLKSFENVEKGFSKNLESTVNKLLEINENRYYDYKQVENNLGKDGLPSNDVSQCLNFLGISKDKNTKEYILPTNNIGNVAFFPTLNYGKNILDNYIEKFKLDTKYEFILTPTGETNHSPCYLTPYYGMCGNKNSENVDWIKEFFNFFFQKENNIHYAKLNGIVPNVSAALKYMAEMYHTDISNCALCGDINFDKFNGFYPLQSTLEKACKNNAKKYMIVLNKDAQGNIQYFEDEKGQYLYNGNEPTEKIYKEFIGKEDLNNYPGYAFCNTTYFLDILEKSLDVYR